MQTVNIRHAKTHLSRLVEQAERGETIVIVRAGRPVARLISIIPPIPQAVLPDSDETDGFSQIVVSSESSDVTETSNTGAAAMIARFAGCWSDWSDEEFARMETERQQRRQAGWFRRPGDDTHAG